MLGDWQVLKASRKRATGGDADGEDEEKPVKKTRGPRKSAAKSKAAPQPVQPAAVPEQNAEPAAAEGDGPAAAEGDGPEATVKAKPAVDLAKEFADKEPRK